MRRNPALLLILLTGASLVFYAIPSLSASTPELAAFGGGGIAGSETAKMQTMALPARIDRVAVRPGGGEAWAFGTSRAPIKGWNPTGLSRGQTVFLRYTPSSGWQMIGPPRDSSGNIINPTMADLEISSTGEGWAVGERGTFIKKPAGSTKWVKHTLSGSNSTIQVLQSLSLTTQGGKTVGFAAGKAATIYRYVNSVWTKESAPLVTGPLGPPGLYIAAASSSDAWAVSDTGTQGVRIYHRTGAGWTPFPIGQPIFDSPPAPGPRGGYNNAAWGSAVAASGSTVWVGGAMRPSETPLGRTNPEAGQQPSDTRPFMIRIAGGVVTSFCPNLYEIRTSSAAGTERLCDRPFPTSSYDVPDIDIVGSQVFAGGLGLFHFSGGGWFREPDTNAYLISISMASPTEGWVATTGDSYLRGGAGRSHSPYVGHWTRSGERASVARWPHSLNERRQGLALEAVALSPDGTTGLAVGRQGGSIYFDRQLGWDMRRAYIAGDFHGVAWPGGVAWGVGDEGIIASYRNPTWTTHPDSGRTPALYSVAFRSPSSGWAVGERGGATHFNGSRWTPFPTPSSAPLYTVIATPQGYLAAGAGGTILENRGGGWVASPRVGSSAREALERLGNPDIYAATVTASGKVIVGGQRSALLISDGAEPFKPMFPPVEGTVLALAAGEGGVLASVSPDDRKFDLGRVAPMRGSILRLQGQGWRDISLNRRIRSSTTTDPSSFDDPAFSIATADGSTGWAAGGSPAGTPSLSPPEGHLRAAPYETGSIYRIDLAGDPAPPDNTAGLDAPAGVNFAVFGESWCGRGLCSSSVGSGTMADETALEIRRQINRAARVANGPKFVLFLGNMRQTGLPEELAEFKRYLRGFSIPVYAALGNRDRFSGLGENLIPNQAGSAGTNEFWKEAFSDMPAPWGRGARRSYIRPLDGYYSTTPAAGHARTHYAFDVIQGGSRVLRVAVIDSSTKSYATSQNPDEPQAAWLTAIVTRAKEPPAVPVIIAMNQPPVFPTRTPGYPNWPAAPLDAAHLQTTAQSGATAVFAAGLRKNMYDLFPARSSAALVPMYIMGGGGGPLGFEKPVPIGNNQAVPPPSLFPSDGYYHGWHMVNLDPDPTKRNVRNQAPHGIKTFMALEYLAMHSLDGESVVAGNTMRFSALGRHLPGGFSDAEQAKATYLRLGFQPTSPSPCEVFAYDGGDICESIAALAPPYTFRSEDPEMADFVVPAFTGSTFPAIDPVKQANQPAGPPGTRPRGTLVLDLEGKHGLLCAFDKGTVGIIVESGYLRRRMTITVTPGTGPCIEGVVRPPRVEPPNPEFPTYPPPDRPEILPEEPSPPSIFRQPTLTHPLIPIIIPAPGPIPAPAPPASAAGARKEEEEAQFEEQGDEGEGADARALPRPRPAERYDHVLGWLTLSSAALTGMMLALGVAAIRRRPQPNYVRVRSW